MTDALLLREQDRREILRLLSRHLPDATAWAYGSRVSGKAHEGSDLDIVLRSPDLSPIPLEKLRAFVQALRDSNIPILVEARDWARLPENFRQEIMKNYVVLREIVSEWREIKLGRHVSSNISSIKSDYSFSKIQYLDTGSITCGRIEQLQSYELSQAPVRAKRLVKEDDIIYSTVRPVQRHYGFIRNPPGNLVVSTGFSVISADKKHIYPLFLYYFLTSYEIVEFLDIIAEASTSTYPSLKTSDIEELDILLPPLPEQKAIASVLSSLDDKIDLLHRQNKTLEAMAEALFRQWFVEEAGEDWQEGCLGDLAVNVTKSAKVDDINSNDVYIGLEHIERKNISLSKTGSGGDVESNKYFFKKMDILFGKLRPYFHKVCFAPFDGICSTDILVIRPKKKHLFGYCLFSFFQDDVVEYANLGSSGTRMPRTDWKTLARYRIAIPNDDKLFKFNEISCLFIKKIEQNQSQILTLEQLRDTLLPKLMSGEVRVAYAHEHIE